MTFKIAILLIAGAQLCAGFVVLRTCECKRHYKPVCASNTETYKNKCVLDCVRTLHPHITFVKQGPCDEDVIKTGICGCSLDYIPVCGNDGNTYPNTCHLSCKYRDRSSLDVAYEGECKPNVPQPNTCTCSDENLPVCGSDHVTYTNDCWLNCATANNPSLSIAYSAPCNLAQQNTCQCSYENKPVCGSDNVTYTNDCWLNCATANNPSLSIASFGSCNVPQQNNCQCSDENLPVCGSDNVTYKNDCWLNCATANNPSLSIAFSAPCNLVQQNTCHCSHETKPVCGSDNVTYTNDCWLNCATANYPTLSIAYFAACYH